MLDKISAYCSIAGLFISLGTFAFAVFIERRIRAFERKVLFNTRIPILVKNLKQHSSQLLKNLDAKSERNIRETLNLCRTIIEDINPKLSGDLRTQGIKIKKTLTRQYKSDFQLENQKIVTWKFWIRVVTLDNLWESYDNLDSLITRIDNLRKDKRTIS
jgi:hypothetical protein